LRSRILLTGSSGFLGKQILKIIDTEDVYTLNRANSFFNIDLSKKVPHLTISFDYVIHCAGKAHSIPNTEIEKSEFFDINVNGTRNLLEGLSKNKLPKYFVFISSVSVYGLTEGKNINERQPLYAKDPYGQSKIQAEKLVINWCNQNNVICTILRLPLLAGQDPPGNLSFMIIAIKRGYYFNISGVEAKKSIVLATDVAKIILKAAKVGGIYNLTDGEDPSIYQISKKISFLLNQKILLNMPFSLANIIAKIGDIFGDAFPLNRTRLNKLTCSLTFDDSKARMSFGWNPNSVLDNFII
jgi:nucleoside-diphosphate-sugar epimerase